MRLQRWLLLIMSRWPDIEDEELSRNADLSALGPIELGRTDVKAHVGLTIDDERSDRMNVDEPAAVGPDIIDSTGLEFVTAAEPIIGPIELELEPTRLLERDKLEVAPL